MQQDIRRLGEADTDTAMALVWRVFEEFEAGEYAPEGVEEFRRYIERDSIAEKLRRGSMLMWGCYMDEVLAGVLANSPKNHISLLFVDARFHRRGIACALVDEMLRHLRQHSRATLLTVNASPYGHEAYLRLGFSDTGPERVVNGIRFIPMHRPL